MDNNSQSRTAASGSFDKIDYKTGVAVGTKNRLDISENHITTQDFGYMKPVYCRMLLPDEDITIETSQFTRLMPMPSPTFGTILNKTRCFFVPFRVLNREWLNFISNNNSYDSNISRPNITRFGWSQFCALLYTLKDTDSAKFQLLFKKYQDGPDGMDICIHHVRQDGSTAKRFFSLTRRGRRMIDLLQCLGYNMPFVWYEQGDYETDYNAFPILSFAKAWLDWICPSRFLVNHLKLRKLVNLYNGQDEMTSEDFLQLVSNDYCCYFDNDIFTTAFNNPNGDEFTRPYDSEIPTRWAGQAYSTRVYDGGRGEGAVTVGTNVDRLNALTVQSLGAIQAMINRGKLAGTKIQDYFKTTFGFQPFNEALNLSSYLGVHNNEIQIGDVMATAGTSENKLGDYAGRGIGYNNDTFKFHAKEHGFFFLTNEIVPLASYPFGTRYDNLAIDRLDFYQPELDNLGYESIRTLQFSGRELEFPSRFDPLKQGLTFGFTPRYSGFKVGQDSLTGDFRFISLNTGLDSWYLARWFNDEERTITEDFLKVESNVYDKIFATDYNQPDHFYIIFKHKVTRNTYLKPIGLSLAEHGKIISVNPND